MQSTLNTYKKRGFTFYSLAISILVLELGFLAVNELYSSFAAHEAEQEAVHRLIAVKKALNSYYKDNKKNPPKLSALYTNGKSFPYARQNDIMDPFTKKEWNYSRNYVKSLAKGKSFTGISLRVFAYLKFDNKKKVWIFERTKPVKKQ